MCKEVMGITVTSAEANLNTQESYTDLGEVCVYVSWQLQSHKLRLCELKSASSAEAEGLSVYMSSRWENRQMQRRFVCSMSFDCC